MTDLEIETQRKIQELQILEQNMQALLAQKQAFQLELNETTNALQETKKTNDDIYKVTGSIMLRADKNVVVKELEEKEKILELRTNTIEKQESLISSKIKELHDDVRKSLDKSKKH